jgi:fluoride exporter
MSDATSAAWVALGGAVGAVLRYATSLALPVPQGGFPWPTLVVNLVGSFLIGVVFGLMGNQALPQHPWQALLTTGFCGGFTTLSAMSLEVFFLLRQQQFTTLFIYTFATVVLGVMATALGYTFTK